jgi:hypothetical protein
MALGEITKQLAQEVLISATTKEPAPAPTPEAAISVIFGELGRMQKALKEDEELLVLFQTASERIRVLEIYAASKQVVVLSGPDSNRSLTRVVAAVESLQLVCKIAKAPQGTKPARVNLVSGK